MQLIREERGIGVIDINYQKYKSSYKIKVLHNRERERLETHNFIRGKILQRVKEKQFPAIVSTVEMDYMDEAYRQIRMNYPKNFTKRRYIKKKRDREKQELIEDNRYAITL